MRPPHSPPAGRAPPARPSSRSPEAERRAIMCGMRIASGILAAGIVATAAAAPVAAVASQQPSRTPASQHPSETTSPLVKQPLPNVQGKTFTSEIVYFPPNARAAPHRHGSAFVYAYVL